MRDGFTKSANWLWQRLTGHRQAASPSSLVVLRLENLAVLTEHLGGAGLNQMIVGLCVRLARVLRPDSPVQILAPGVFAVLVPDRDVAEVMRIARRLQIAGQHSIAAGGSFVNPVLTGLVIHADAGLSSPPSMIDAAQTLLDQIRPHQLGTVSLHDLGTERQPIPLADNVCAAASADQIVAFFQPQVSCHTGHVTGFEALARWQHPTRGLVTPAGFMPRMTDADHNALTLVMLRQALAALKVWDAEGWNVPTVSLNISRCELADPSFATALLLELDQNDIEPRRLVLEVLESVGPINAESQARANLTRLSDAGCKLDLDDFGTGYACLEAIRQFGVHRIKIDRSFVTGCDIDTGQQRMILAILALAERLGVTTLAEGVETPDEHSFLAQMGCDETQGFAIGRPMPLIDTLAFLSRHSARSDSLPRLQQRRA